MLTAAENSQRLDEMDAQGLRGVQSSKDLEKEEFNLFLSLSGIIVDKKGGNVN